MYHLEDSIETKIEIICKQVYGAKDIDISTEARNSIERFKKQGFANLPICMAKSHLSLTGNPEIKGAPTDFEIYIKDVRASVGAGFLYPLVGKTLLMPGLSARPALYDIDLNVDTGEVEGLF